MEKCRAKSMPVSRVRLRRVAYFCAALIAVTGILGSMMPQAAGADPMALKRIEQRFANSILRHVPAYWKSSRDRALAACINWEDATLDFLPVPPTFWCHTGEGSDVPVFISKLMSCALQGCERIKRTRDCKCVPVAKNKTLVLRLPDAVFERLLRQPSLEFVECLLPRGGLPVGTTAEACSASGGRVLSAEEAQRLREEISTGVVP